MVSRLVPGGVLAAAAGAALLIAAASGPSSAFTLSSPSLDQPVVTADIQQVWWDRWGRWHPNRWHPYYHRYYHPYHYYHYYHHHPYYYRPWRRCWWTWHGRVCGW